MNGSDWKRMVVLRAGMAGILLFFVVGLFFAQDPSGFQGVPEACPDYHDYSLPQSLDTSTLNVTYNPSSPNWSRVLVDSQGYYHITYQASTGVLKYGTNRGGSGFLAEQPVASNMDPDGWSPTLALDSNDKAHIVYGQTSTNPSSSKLYYVTNASGAWSQPVHISTTTKGESGLAFDHNGVLHLLFSENSDSTCPCPLKYTTWNGSSWSTPITVDSGNDSDYSIKYPTLMFTPNNKAIFCYQKYASNNYALWWGQMNADGTGIQNSQLASDVVVDSISMAMDGQGSVYFAYLYQIPYSSTVELWTKTNKAGSMSDLLNGTQVHGNLYYGTAVGVNPDGTVFVVYNLSYISPVPTNVVVIPPAGCGEEYTATVAEDISGSIFPRIDASKHGKAHIVWANRDYVLKHAETSWVSPDCGLVCTASASPTTGTSPLAVIFNSSVTTFGTCTGSPAYAWTFGDGQTSTMQNPNHSFASPGNYSWTFTVTQNGTTCSQTGTIHVNGPIVLPGDCDGNGIVTIGEVQKVINAFLGLPSTCP